MNNFHDLDIKSNLTESEGKGDVSGVHNFCEPVKEECDVVENKDIGLSENEEIDEYKFDMKNTKIFQGKGDMSGVHNFCEPVKEECDVVENKDIGLSENEEIDEYKFDMKNTKIFHSGKDGISEFFQHSDLNTSVKSEDPEVGIESSCARRTGEKTDVFEDEIEENKCFIQQYLDKDEKLWGSIDTISLKQNGTIECSQYTTFDENTQLGIGIQSGCDEITNRETNVSESEDSKCFVHQYLDEEGKICNSIDTISLKKESAERELSEKEAVEANACKPSDYNTSATKRCNLKCNIGSVHIKVEGGTKFNCYLCDYSALSSKNLLRHINNGHRGEKKRKFHMGSMSGESERYKCDLCAYSAPTKSYLQRHNKRVHLGVKEEKKHKCHLCDYISTHITNLKCHIDGVHLKVKKHKCHLCEYCTAYNDNLKRHINTVHLKVVKGKKQKCYFCNYSSTRSTYLKRHLDSVHPKEKNTSITGAAIVL